MNRRPGISRSVLLWAAGAWITLLLLAAATCRDDVGHLPAPPTGLRILPTPPAK